MLELIGGIGIDNSACNGCGNCTVVCPGNYELLCLGMDGPETLTVKRGVAVFVSAERCRRDLPGSTCRLCHDACPAGAVYYPGNDGFLRLETRVLERGLCTGCGACAAVCPDRAVKVEEYPEVVGECTNCGLCVVHCPPMHPRTPSEEPLGRCLKVLAARATRMRRAASAQDGGVVSAILGYALSRGIIDAAVVAGSGAEPWKPSPRVAVDADGVFAAAGTKYTSSPTLTGIREAVEMGFRRLGVVALPCQSLAMERLAESEKGRELRSAVVLHIALFCKANLHYDGILRLSARYGFSLTDVRRFSIRGRELRVGLPTGVVKIPLKEVLKFARPACSRCTDFTGLRADFSVGAVGSPEGYSTVIVRSPRALGMIADMLREKWLEARALSKHGLALLLRLARSKSRNTDAKRTAHVHDASY